MLGSKFNFFNKSLAMLLSIVINGSVITQIAYCEVDKSSGIKERAKSWISGEIKRIAIGTVATVALTGLAIVLENESRKYRVEQYASELRKTFNVVDNVFTKKQEGVGWCWIACLQGMYKHKGIELSQEHIFRAIFNRNPEYLESRRTEKLIIGTTAPNHLVRSINSLNTNYEYNKAIIHINGRRDETAIKNSILDYYNLIGRTVFAIIDSFTGSFAVNDIIVVHFVNVTNISEDAITLEDPQTGLSRTEKLQDFCQRYYTSGIIGSAPMIEMYSVTASGLNLATETHYVCDSGEDTGFHKFSVCNSGFIQPQTLLTALASASVRGSKK
ncbi:MAG: hypothetical protein LBK29_02360 [Oscillospiraceae bacterium]|jgi:hypothetical protein|nr:hypothetical protein [Oscillospiraceae bacterium]